LNPDPEAGQSNLVDPSAVSEAKEQKYGSPEESSPTSARDKTVSTTDRVDRHIVTSYQITRGEVSVSQVKSVAGENVVKITCDNSSSAGSSGSSAADTRAQQQQQQLPASLLARQLEKVKDDIYRLLSEDSDASSLGKINLSLIKFCTLVCPDYVISAGLFSVLSHSHYL
jgi:hypothetical protein